MKLCIFDLDGTLLDSLPSITYYGNRALKINGFEEIEDYRMLVGDGRDTLIRRMMKKTDAGEEWFEKIRRVYDDGYESEPLYLTAVYDGIEELLETLKKAGVKCAVLSNKPDNVANAVIKSFFKDGIFDIVYGQREGVPKKPSPKGVFEIMAAENADAAEVYFTNIDINTGKNAGVKTIGVLWGFRDEQELKDAGADFIASKPNDIANIVLS